MQPALAPQSSQIFCDPQFPVFLGPNAAGYEEDLKNMAKLLHKL